MSKAGGWHLRLVSWNVRGLRDDPSALIDATRDLAPDLLLLQESPQVLLPTARLHWLAGRMGLQVLQGGRGGRGLAILATDEVAGQVIRRGLRPVPQRLTDANSVFPRGIAAARLSVPGGGAVVVATVHLALDEQHRAEHARRLVELIEGTGAPVLLGGDFNESAAGDARSLLETVVHDPARQDAVTFPARSPQVRIDAVLASPQLRVRAARAVTFTRSVRPDRLAHASDHLPALLEVTIPGAARSA